MNLIIFDIETTGFSPNYHEIIQIAALKVRAGDWDAAERFDTFVRPQQRVPRMITELTGIAHAQVANAPTPTQALLRFAEFAGAGAVMLAHNGLRFDFPFLHHTCLQNGLGVGPTNAIDSMHLSKQLWGKGGKHSLQEVIKRLGISTAGVRCHDARGDVHLLGQAVRQIWKQLNMDFQTCPVVEGKGVLPLLV